MSSRKHICSGMIFILGIAFFLPTILHAEPAVMMSHLAGGLGGSHFVALPKNTHEAISSITVRSSKVINSIQLTFSNGKITSQTMPYGGEGKIASTFRLNPGEYITRVYGFSGKIVYSLAIMTSTGRKYAWGGKGGQSRFSFSGSKQDPIIGLWGRSSNYVDAIGVVKYSKLQKLDIVTKPPKLGITTKLRVRELDQFRPQVGRGNEKSVEVGGLDFPKPGAKKSEINDWIYNYNQRLEDIINELAGSDPGLNGFWQGERNRCNGDGYCQMTYRREAIAYLTGVN